MPFYLIYNTKEVFTTYKYYRKQAGMSIEGASSWLHVAPRTLSKYESGETQPAPQVALAMGRAYKNPALIFCYCQKECPIGANYSYQYLNNVDLSPQNILLKLYQEYREVGKALECLMSVAVNKKTREDFNEEQIHNLERDLHHLLDLEHTIQVLKMEMDRCQWVKIPNLVSQHNSKCYRQGYAVDEQVKETGREYGVPGQSSRRRRAYGAYRTVKFLQGSTPTGWKGMAECLKYLEKEKIRRSRPMKKNRPRPKERQRIMDI